MAQLVRAPPCHGGGRRFEPVPGRVCFVFLLVDIPFGVLAQLGEHLPYKQRVTGSSPVGPTHRMICRKVHTIRIWMDSRVAKGDRL